MKQKKLWIVVTIIAIVCGVCAIIFCSSKDDYPSDSGEKEVRIAIA